MLNYVGLTSHPNPILVSDFSVEENVKAKLESSTFEGFIRHPKEFPISYRKIWFNGETHQESVTNEGLGLCFLSDKYFSPGKIVEISIPLRGEEQKFKGKVVLVRNKGENYEIGIWLCHKGDASRIRIVEQICHIETYLQAKKYKEGPFVSREKVAEEWITKFAASFPTFRSAT